MINIIVGVIMRHKLTSQQRDENYRQNTRQIKQDKAVEVWAKEYPFDPFKKTITGKDWKAYKQARKAAKDQLKSLNSVKPGL